ncbi:hypothetical protein [Pectinatus frisingensis]|uniref:hypothetical protein n=1 Tax=Pectinatus frisingensis TaxID=865 RepID=UPI0018C7CD61|nr:hypothetical protein [Pectinatus frisingensis]
MVTNNGKLVNTYIRTLYSEGLSSIMISFFNTNLSFSFAPCIGKNNVGFDQFDISKSLRTTINYEMASFLYQLAMSVVNGKYAGQQISGVLQCNNNTTLIFEYKPDQYNQMGSCLTINKNNEMISFRFKTHIYRVKENGQMITKIIQSGLGAFAKTLDGYLTGINADGHLNKLLDDLESLQNENQQVSLTALG